MKMKNSLYNLFLAAIYLVMIQLSTSAQVINPDHLQSERSLIRELNEEIALMNAKNAEVVSKELPLINEIQALLNSLPNDSKKPITELFTTTQAYKFGELTSKQKYFEMQRMIISGRIRDLEFIKELVLCATAKYLISKDLLRVKNSEFTQSLISIFDTQIDNSNQLDNFTHVNDNIDQQFNNVINQIGIGPNDYNVNAASTYKSYLKNKYKLNDADVFSDKLTKDELNKWNGLSAEVISLIDYIIELRCTRIMYTTMTLDYTSALEDVADSNGTFESIGTKIAKVSQNWSDEMKFICVLGRKVGEKIDSQYVKQREEIVNKAKK
jgi:hypothetical protein